jgi:hypothetical protein
MNQRVITVFPLVLVILAACAGPTASPGPSPTATLTPPPTVGWTPAPTNTQYTPTTDQPPLPAKSALLKAARQHIKDAPLLVVPDALFHPTEEYRSLYDMQEPFAEVTRDWVTQWLRLLQGAENADDIRLSSFQSITTTLLECNGTACPRLVFSASFEAKPSNQNSLWSEGLSQINSDGWSRQDGFVFFLDRGNSGYELTDISP